MNRLLHSACTTAALLLAAISSAQNTPPTPERAVIVCRITGEIDPGMAVVVKRAIAEARELHAEAVVFRIDTPGGRVDSAVDIASAITDAPTRTIAYIEGMGAISAGALISFACDDIIMSPGSAIGAATPVIPTAEGLMPTGEKEVSFMRAKMRSLAESNGHNPNLAEAMVDKDIELRGYRDSDGRYTVYSIAGSVSHDDAPAESKPVMDHAPGAVVYPDNSELVDAAGKLLTLTPSEAVKFGLIPKVVSSLDDAVAQYGLSDAKRYLVEPNWAEKVFRLLTAPTVVGLLLLIGLGALYYEIKTGGFGLIGVVGIVALVLLFGAHLVLGLADVIDLILILIGFALILAEVFVIPGFGVAGVSGILCVLIGTYLALVKVTVPRYSWDYDRLSDVLYSLTFALVALLVFIGITWKLFPKSRLYRSLVMGSTQQATQGYVAPVQEAITPKAGLRGTTTSMLRPAGRARFGEATLQVVSRGAFIPSGTDVEIIEVDGARVVVERSGGAA